MATATMKDQLARDLNLTPLESEILRHRLECPDGIADALEMDFNLAHEVCKSLLESGFLATLGGGASSVIHAVLADAVEGSTYYGASKHNDSDQKLAAISRAGNSLAAKIGKLVGRELSYPEY